MRFQPPQRKPTLQRQGQSYTRQTLVIEVRKPAVTVRVALTGATVNIHMKAEAVLQPVTALGILTSVLTALGVVHNPTFLTRVTRGQLCLSVTLRISHSQSGQCGRPAWHFPYRMR